ncbi:hypothetical protein MJH12_04205 [bacterium]|nr:hypothetical protein [bacterium]
MSDDSSFMNISICLLLSLFALICVILFVLIGSFLQINLFKRIDSFFQWTLSINQFLISMPSSKLIN